MTMPDVIQGDRHYAGDVSFGKSVTLPAGTITDEKVAPGAKLSASKLQHQYERTIADDSNETPESFKSVVHVVHGATGVLVGFQAGAVVAATGGSVDLNVKKNGTSVLTGVVTVDSGTAAYGTESGTFSSTALAAGDVLEITGQVKGFDTGDYKYDEEFAKPAGDTLPDYWGVDQQTGNSTADYVSDEGTGGYSLIHDSTSEAQAMQLTGGDNLQIDLNEQPIVEWWVRVDGTGTNALGSADQRLVIGVCSNHTNAEDALDATTYNAWFLFKGADANIYVEADDNNTNTDDQDSGIDLVDNAENHFLIDFSDLSAVKFEINGVEQSGASVVMSNISSETLVQPIVCIQRDAGAEEEKVYIDRFRVRGGRTGGTLCKGLYATLVWREDAA